MYKLQWHITFLALAGETLTCTGACTAPCAQARALSVVSMLTRTCTYGTGLLCSALVSEICSRPGVSDSCSSDNKFVIVVKIASTLFTGFHCYLILRQMELKTEYADTQTALAERGRGMKMIATPAWTLGARLRKTMTQHWFLVFVLLPLNLIHPAPGLSFPIIIEQLGIRPKYRVESLIVGAMLPRVYHVFVLYKLKLLTSVLSLDSSLIVRNESAIRQLNDPGLSQPQLAFKIALERQPIRIIAMCWMVCVMSASLQSCECRVVKQ